MSRIVKKFGYIFKFPTEHGKHGYCQWLPHGARFFKFSTKKELSVSDVLDLPEAFYVTVYHDTPGRYGWEKIGEGAYPPEYNEYPLHAMQDLMSGKIQKICGDTIVDSTFDEAKDLEVAAVWAHPHVVDRLLALLNGTKSIFLESMKIKRID